MKTHTDLKELLEDFSWFMQLNRLYTKECINKKIIEFDSSNSLVSGKQRPLAKNKHTENNCDFYADELEFINQNCDCEVGNCKILKERLCRDASSR